MNRNGKLAIAQTVLLSLSVIITIIILAMFGTSHKGLKAEVGIALLLGVGALLIAIAELVIAIIQIVFGSKDKMWIALSAGIVVLASFVIGFIPVIGIGIATSAIAIILNIITIVKTK